jgi:hypothetical protein
MLLRTVYVIAGVFLIVNAIYIGQHMLRGGAFLLLAGVSPALVAALALGVILILRNVKKQPEEPAPTDPEEDS